MTSARYRDLLEHGMLAYIDCLDALGGEGDSVAERRRAYRDRSLALCGPPPAGVEASDFEVAGAQGPIPARAYRPGGAARGAVLYLHGGGWVLGDLQTHDDICRDLAAQSACRVIAVDYRCAPDHPYPAAFEDCLAVLAHLRAAEPDTPLVVAGDSSGANLAAALALHARDRAGPALAGQVLVYPVLDADLSLPACAEFADAPLLTRAEMQWFWQAYLGGAAPDAFAAPLLASDLSALAPAFLVPAACDPLRDDAVVYARRLREAGSPAELFLAEGLSHGFIRARHHSPVAAGAFARIAGAAGRLCDAATR